MVQRQLWFGIPFLPKEARSNVIICPIEVDEVWIAEPKPEVEEDAKLEA